MNIQRSGAQPSIEGAAQNFTGMVRVDPLFKANGPARAVSVSVTFEAGARTVWHSHPLGQSLIVTAGSGWVQRWGGPVEEINIGDVIWIEPGEKHWHGATAKSTMTHIEITEQWIGKTAEWYEAVSEEQYCGATPVRLAG